MRVPAFGLSHFSRIQAGEERILATQGNFRSNQVGMA